MRRSRGECDEEIRGLDEAIANFKKYGDIQEDYCNGKPDTRITKKEAEMLAQAWIDELMLLADRANITVSYIWSEFESLDYAEKRKVLIKAKEDTSKRYG